MPISPIKSRINASFLEDGEKEAVKCLREKGCFVDDTVYPDHRRVAVAANPALPGYRIFKILGPTPIWLWDNVGNYTKLGLEEYLAEHRAAKVAGGFAAPRDMNPVAREHMERAHYKNRALRRHATLLLNRLNNGVSADDVFQKGLCPDVDNVF